MVKKFVLVLVALVLLLGAAGAFLVLNANKLVEAARPYLESQGSRLIGAPVKVGKVSFQLFPDPQFVLTDFKLGHSSESSLGVEEVRTHLQLWPLLSGTLAVDELTVVAPQATLLKTKEGMVIAGLPSRRRTPEDKKNTDEPAQVTQPTASGAKGRSAPLALNLDSFQVRSANITLVDETSPSPRRVQLSSLDVSTSVQAAGRTATLRDLSIVSAVSLNDTDLGPLKVTAPELLVSLDQLRVAGSKILIDFLQSQTTIKVDALVRAFTGDMEIDTQCLELRNLLVLKALVPSLETFQPHGEVHPQMKVKLTGPGRYNADGTATVTGVGFLANGHHFDGVTGVIGLTATPGVAAAKSTDLALNMNGLPLVADFAAELAGTTARITNAVIEGLGGSITADATLNLSGPKAFRTTSRIAKLSIPEVLKALKLPGTERAQGTIELVTAQLAGTLGKDFLRSLSGPVEIRVQDTELKDFNLLRNVLAKVRGLPFLGGALTEHVPAEFQTALAVENTPLKTFSSSLVLNNGLAQIKKLDAASSLFRISGDGAYKLLEKDIDLGTEIVLATPLSFPLVQKVKELSALQQTSGELVIPLEIHGVAPKLIVVPELKSLLRRGVENKIREKATKALGDLLGF